jgi:hypothetical protein
MVDIATTLSMAKGKFAEAGSTGRIAPAFPLQKPGGNRRSGEPKY